MQITPKLVLFLPDRMTTNKDRTPMAIKNPVKLLSLLQLVDKPSSLCSKLNPVKHSVHSEGELQLLHPSIDSSHL